MYRIIGLYITSNAQAPRNDLDFKGFKKNFILTSKHTRGRLKGSLRHNCY